MEVFMKQTATQIKMPGMLNVLNISPIRSFDTEPWAAFYCRLSQDDGLDGESNSIQHQKQILERYAKEHGITRYKFYVDDGIMQADSLGCDDVHERTALRSRKC